MKPEKHFLIRDLLDDPDGEARRAATLVAGRRVLRHKRWRRAAARGLAVVAVVALAGVFLRHRQAPGPGPISVAPAPAPAVRYLTDDQLLAMFPNTPVGLATVGGRKVLVFPRPSDQEQFVGRF